MHHLNTSCGSRNCNCRLRNWRCFLVNVTTSCCSSSLLTEAYPESTGELRNAALPGEDDLDMVADMGGINEVNDTRRRPILPEVVRIYKTEQYYGKLREEYLPWLTLQINIIMESNCVLDGFSQPRQSTYSRLRNGWTSPSRTLRSFSLQFCVRPLITQLYANTFWAIQSVVRESEIGKQQRD